MRQAEKLQERMAEVQKDLASKTCEASSGGGMVIATVNGNQELVGLKIDPAIVDQKDMEMLQDLVAAAVNEAFRRSKDMASQEMGKLTSGLGLNIQDIFK